MAIHAGKVSPDDKVLLHQIDIAWLYVRFTLFSRMHGYTIDEWDRPTKSNEVGLIPDIVFTVSTDKRPYRFITEVDRNTETLISPREYKDLQYKFEKYEEYIEGGYYEQKYGDHKGRIFFTAPSLKRLLHIISVCDKVKKRHPNRYWFAVMADLKNQDPYHARIWRHAGSDEMFSLI